MSVTGSGNTWMRYLIQTATGYMTGSDYFSKELFENGFPGESFNDGSTLVVKSHEWYLGLVEIQTHFFSDVSNTILSIIGRTGRSFFEQ